MAEISEPAVVRAADPRWWRRLGPVRSLALQSLALYLIWMLLLFSRWWLQGLVVAVLLPLVPVVGRAVSVRVRLHQQAEPGGIGGVIIDNPDRIEVTPDDLTLVDAWAFVSERVPRTDTGQVSVRDGGVLGLQLRIPVAEGVHQSILVGQMDTGELREAFVTRGWSWQDTGYE